MERLMAPARTDRLASTCCYHLHEMPFYDAVQLPRSTTASWPPSTYGGVRDLLARCHGTWSAAGEQRISPKSPGALAHVVAQSVPRLCLCGFLISSLIWPLSACYQFSSD